MPWEYSSITVHRRVINISMSESQHVPPDGNPHTASISQTSKAVQRTGYMGFGSFMVEQSVEDMIKEPSASYMPPQRPFSLSQPQVPLSETTPLGTACRPLFMIDFDSWVFINHGAFGGVCVPAHSEASQWREYCEQQPLKFLDRELFPQVVRVMRELAEFVGAHPQDLVLLPNATTGLNVVIQSAGLQPGDCLYMLDIGYGSVKKMAAAACGGAEVVYGHVGFPVKDAQAIIDIVANTMPANTRLAVFDAVTSNTAVQLPIQQLVALCKARGVRVLIDAAHALGQQDINLDELGADYYVTNCHKWLAAPRGSAMMWVHRACQPSIKPLVVSHGSGCGFVSDFIWDGCRDYAPYLGISAALHMWQYLGVTRCRQYMRQLLCDAVELLTKRWGTCTLVPLEMCSTGMALVQLPASLAAQQPATSADAKYIQDLLHYQYHIECPVKCIQGELYVRISAHIYNHLPDYEALAQAVSSIQQQRHPDTTVNSQAGGSQ